MYFAVELNWIRELKYEFSEKQQNYSGTMLLTEGTVPIN